MVDYSCSGHHTVVVVVEIMETGFVLTALEGNWQTGANVLVLIFSILNTASPTNA